MPQLATPASANALPTGAIGGPVEASWPTEVFNGLAIVGEAPGRDEVRLGHPFAGKAGARLDRGLAAAGLLRAATFIANPFRFRPDENRIMRFFAAQRPAAAAGIALYRDLGKYRCRYPIVPHQGDLLLLRRQLDQLRPRAIVALGNTALWALTGENKGVTKLAGRWLEGVQLDGLALPAPVIVTYHPSYLERNRGDQQMQEAFHRHLSEAARRAAGRDDQAPQS